MTIAIERRARFEMAAKRSAKSKKITIEVFHVQTPSGSPWDIGDTHYVEVPPEGIFDVFEVTELELPVDAESEFEHHVDALSSSIRWRRWR